MQFKNFGDLSTALSAQLAKLPPKPKHHVDLLYFGDGRALATYILHGLQKVFHDGIFELTHDSFKGYRILIHIPYGKSEQYVAFLSENKMLDRSMRVGMQEEEIIAKRQIGGPLKINVYDHYPRC